MKPDRSWERALRQRVRDALAAAPDDVRRRARRVRKARDGAALANEILFRLLFTLFLGILVWLAAAGHSPAMGEAVFALWSVQALLWGRLVIRNLSTNIDAAWLLLPLSREEYRAIAMRNIVRTFWRPAADGLVAIAILLSERWPDGFALALTLPAAALYAVGMVTATFWLTRVPIPSWVTTAPLWTTVVLAMTEKHLHLIRSLVRWLSNHAETVRWFGPGGWATRLASADLIALPLLLAMGATALLAWRTVRRNSEPERLLLWNYCHEVDAEDTEAFNDSIASFQDLEKEASEEEVLRARDEHWHRRLNPDDAGGWIERLVLLWASERDRLVMEFAMGATPPWTRQAWQAAAFLAAGVALQFIARWTGYWAGTLGIAGLFCGMVALLRGGPFASGLALPSSPPAAGGIGGIAAFGLYPVTPADILRLARKIAIVRGLAFAPALATAVWLAVSALDMPAGRSTWIAVKLILMLIAACPWAAVFNASKSAGRGRGRGFESVGVVLLLLVLALFTVGFLIATAVLEPPYDLAALAGVAIVSELTFAFHRFTFHHGLFDLIAQPRR